MTTLVLIALGALGLGGVVLALMRPRIALIALVVLDVSNINGVIQENTGFAPFKPEIAIAIIAILMLVRARRFRFAWSPVHLGILVLFAGFLISFTTSADPTTGFDTLSDRGTGLFYFVIVFVLALSTDQIESLAKAAVVVLGALALLTVVQEYAFHNSTDFFGLSTVPLVQENGALTPRHAGTSSDVNFWARLLILFVPIAMSIAAAAKGYGRALLWAGTAIPLILGIYLTQSRGGFIALLVAIVVWCLIAGRRSRLALLALPVLLVIAAPIIGISSRLETLGGVTGSTFFADESVVTRERFQLDAIRMFLDSPITGHGIGSYPALFAQYDAASNFYKPVTIVPAAHNFYLEQLADGGVVLMVAWFVFFGSILFAAVRALILARGSSDPVARLLPVGVIAGLIGWLTASIFLHLSDFRAVLLVAAMAALVDIRARAMPQTMATPIRDARPARWRTPVLAGLAVLSLVAVPLSLATASSHYSVTSILAVVRQAEPVDGNSAYALDVVSRGHIPATLAEVVSREVTAESVAAHTGTTVAGGIVTTAQSRLGGAVQLVATATSETEAAALGAESAQAAIDAVARLHSGYVLQGSTAEPILVSSDHRAQAAVLAALGLVLAALAVLSGRADRRRRSRPSSRPRSLPRAATDLILAS